MIRNFCYFSCFVFCEIFRQHAGHIHLPTGSLVRLIVVMISWYIYYRLNHILFSQETNCLYNPNNLAGRLGK